MCFILSVVVWKFKFPGRGTWVKSQLRYSRSALAYKVVGRRPEAGSVLEGLLQKGCTVREVGECGPSPSLVLSGHKHGGACSRELSLLNPGKLEVGSSKYLWDIAQSVRWGVLLRGYEGRRGAGLPTAASAISDGELWSRPPRLDWRQRGASSPSA